MNHRIKHTKALRVRKTISLPEDAWRLCGPRAALFPDFSKYIASLVLADAQKKGQVAA